MKIRRFGLLICLACALCTTIGSILPTKASEKPSTGFLIAALEHQQTSCGSSLQVRYTVEGLKPPKVGGLHYEARYVRTPSIQFKEVKKGRLRSDAPGDYDWCCGNNRYSFDRSMKVCKEQSTGVAPDSWVVGVLAKSPTPMRMGELMDPVLLPLAGRTLMEIASDGVVNEVQEIVDGYQCWRVDVLGKRLGSTGPSRAYSIWLDPGVGFNPRRVVVSTGDNPVTKVTEYDFTDYRSLSDEVYFPMQITIKYDETGTRGLVMKAQEATCGKEVSAEDISVVFPSGMKVRVLPDNVETTIP